MFTFYQSYWYKTKNMARYHKKSANAFLELIIKLHFHVMNYSVKRILKDNNLPYSNKFKWISLLRSPLHEKLSKKHYFYGHTIKLNYNRLYLNKQQSRKHQRKCLKFMNSLFKLSYIKRFDNILSKNFGEEKTKK